MKLPFLNREMTDFMGMVALGRRNPREDLVNMLRIGMERIRAGISFLVFPQGSRSKVFDRAQFSSLCVKIAEKAGCPICPIAVDTRCLPYGTRDLSVASYIVFYAKQGTGRVSR